MSSVKLESNRPIWESSRRPLHPKCVWIGTSSKASNGAHRHFIFDYDLTNSYRSRNDASTFRSHFHRFEKSQSFHGLETKMDSLSVIGSSDKIRNERIFSSFSDQPETERHDEFDEFDDALQPFDDELSTEPMNTSKETTITSSMKQICNEIDSSKDQLTERVLQWLDLASGRGHSLARCSDNIGKSLYIPRRRSFTAKETQKMTELKEEALGKPKVRRELLHQLSVTFNEGSVKDSSNPLNWGDLFPVTYKCSRKFLSLRRSQKVTDTLEPLDLQSLMPLKLTNKISHKNLSIRAKPQQLEYFEDQYRSIIQRQILETSCNTQVAKRQLHIFMPNLPKRCIIVNDSDKISQLISPKSVDSDSCLSCRLATT